MFVYKIGKRWTCSCSGIKGNKSEIVVSYRILNVMGFDALHFNRSACVRCAGKCDEYVLNVDSGQPGQCLQCGCDTLWHAIYPGSTAATCSQVTHSYVNNKKKFMETRSQPMETTGGGGRKKKRKTTG